MDRHDSVLTAFGKAMKALDQTWPDAPPGTIIKALKAKAGWTALEILSGTPPRKAPLVLVTVADTQDLRVLGPGAIVCPHCRAFLSTANMTLEIEEDRE